MYAVVCCAHDPPCDNCRFHQACYRLCMESMALHDIQPVELMTEQNTPAKVAIVHDLLTQHGGAELTLDVLHRLFPAAPIFTLVYNKHVMGDRYRTARVRTSALQRWPLGVKKYQWYVPFMPSLVEQYRLFEYDVVISSASAFAKGVLTAPETLHLSYCHSPTRYLWSDTHTYVDDLRLLKPLRRMLNHTLTTLRTWDYVAAQRPTVMLANSQTVQRRIEHYYDRTAPVVRPPVVLDGMYGNPTTSAQEQQEPFYLIVSRLRPHKRIDMAIEACIQAGVSLKIAGEGDDRARLESIVATHERSAASSVYATPESSTGSVADNGGHGKGDAPHHAARSQARIEFLGRVSDAERNRLLATCQAFLHPQYEDYGITAIEAMAAGAPVIAYGKGGALETVKEGITGTFFQEQTAASMAHALRSFDRGAYNPSVIAAHAHTLGLRPFVETFTRVLQESWDAHRAWVQGTPSAQGQSLVQRKRLAQGTPLVRGTRRDTPEQDAPEQGTPEQDAADRHV